MPEKAYALSDRAATRLGRVVRFAESIVRSGVGPDRAFPAVFQTRLVKLTGYLCPGETRDAIPQLVNDPEAHPIATVDDTDAEEVSVDALYMRGYYYANSIITVYQSANSRNWYPLHDGQQIVPGKTGSAIAKGSSGNVTVWTANFGAATSNTLQAREEGLICASQIASGKKVRIAWQSAPSGIANNGHWAIVSAEIG